jgi:hypothetical protein
MPLLSSHNHFACLEVDASIKPHICVANGIEVVQTHSHPPIPVNPHHCVRASSTVSRCLAEASANNSKPKGFVDIVLMFLHTHANVFSETAFQSTTNKTMPLSWSASPHPDSAKSL